MGISAIDSSLIVGEQTHLRAFSILPSRLPKVKHDQITGSGRELPVVLKIALRAVGLQE